MKAKVSTVGGADTRAKDVVTIRLATKQPNNYSIEIWNRKRLFSSPSPPGNAVAVLASMKGYLQ